MNNNFLAAVQSMIGLPLGENSISPTGRFLNGVLQSAEEGCSVVAFSVREEMTNPFGALHGGMAAAMLDDVMGMTVAALGREHWFTTVNLSIDFLNAAKVADVLHCTVQVVRSGRNIVHIEGKLERVGDGKLIAKAVSNLVNTGKPTML